MKKHLLTGIAILLPMAISLLILTWLIDFLTAPFVSVAKHLLIQFDDTLGIRIENHEFVANTLSRILVIVFLFFTTLLLHFLARKYFFSWVLKFFNTIFLRIPLFKGIYRLTQDVAQAVFDQNNKPFKETALLQFPHEGTQVLGFVTGTPPDLLKKLAPEAELSVFVPTSPHPMSGFLLLCPQKQVKLVDIPVEDAFKFIISCGVVPLDKTTSSEEKTDANTH